MRKFMIAEKANMGNARVLYPYYRIGFGARDTAIKQFLESPFWCGLCPENEDLAEEHYTEEAAEGFFVTYQVLFDHEGKNVLAPQWLVDAMNE
jgi:hypothetical protein